MKFIAQRYHQGEQEYLSLVMDLKTIYLNSKVLIYDKDDYGYQRPLDEKHSNKIKNKVLSGNGLFPTSIILSIDAHLVNKIISEIEINSVQALNFVSLTISNFEKSEDHLFRIVDGQHRIAGLAGAAEHDPEIWGYELNVIVLIIPEEKRVIELDVFNDINATPKKLKTDLVILAKQQYILLGQKGIDSKTEMEEYLAIRTAFILNEEIGASVWHNAIKFEKEINSQIGIIGIAAFKKAIAPLVKEFLNNKGKVDLSLSDLNELADEIAHYLNDAWNIVAKKWEDCFGDFDFILESEQYNFRYNNSYYLQKTTGVNAINQILHENRNEQEPIEKFKEIIDNSPLIEEDWIKGGKLSGLTSGSGFKKAVSLIKYGEIKEKQEQEKQEQEK
ncbi:DGQHR domain-containing protein [Bacillus sp. NEB1478]|uniref:DGQHR domain-containing protein n=1 Tax=Bacillus sp. NEB1478 TaxID=3073816 RepID=UPI0028731A6D|nr:DGQHR domain-containing protein [Bacillus sp. NEB1478]WNB91846.1 DGQHR domain-containing protein [Bacillus sp. NEB1478]